MIIIIVGVKKISHPKKGFWKFQRGEEGREGWPQKPKFCKGNELTKTEISQRVRAQTKTNCFRGVWIFSTMTPLGWDSDMKRLAVLVVSLR